jgi:hypothetical protein
MPTSHPADFVPLLCPPCPECGEREQVQLTGREFHDLVTPLADGRMRFIQDALPDRDAGFRELVKTGTHPACWDRMFAFLDDEDDDEDEGCPGHPDDDYSIARGEPAGVTHYCDGSCR